MQFIEIAREVDKANLKLLIFDEPTAVLTETDAEKLLAIMRGLAAKGHAILFITHRLDEVLAVANRITVLRDGEVVGTPDPKTTTVARIAELMVGRPAAVAAQRRFFAPTTEPALGIEHLSVDMPGERVEDVSLAVRRGEILGIGGLAGPGKLGIADGIMGLCPAWGRVVFGGKLFPLDGPGEGPAR